MPSQLPQDNVGSPVSQTQSMYSQPYQRQYMPPPQMQFSMPPPPQRQQQMSPNNLGGIMGVSNLGQQQQINSGNANPYNYFRPQQYQQDPYMNYVQNQQQEIQQRAMEQASIQNAQQAEVLQQQQAAQQGAKLIAQQEAYAPVTNYNAPDWQAG
jgi:hypothetical protein